MATILSRIQQISINEGITITYMEKKIGASKGVLSRAIKQNTDIQAKWLNAIVENFPMYSSEWLLTGHGEMLKTSQKVNNTIKGNGNQVAGGNIGVGNISITMPESGTQKIIKPSGEIEVQRTDPAIKDDERLAELRKTVELMQQRITLMEDNMRMKDDLIASLKETIELLRHKQ